MLENAGAHTPSARFDEYFATLGWKPFRFQRTVWRAYRDGCSGLLHSATGTGKTLAAWGATLLDWMHEHPNPDTWESNKPPPLRVLWLTPLRALAADTESSLRDPLQKLGIPWRLESRTGDSSGSLKAKQLRSLPTALITTPESLSIMLSHAALLPQFASAQAVIIDEWHELLGTKRGVQAELGLARLRKLNPGLRVWGLSATLGNLNEALSVLVGPGRADAARIIEGYRKKRMKLESLIPAKIDRFPWAGHIGTRMVPEVAEAIDGASSVLVFANTRSQVEIWYRELLHYRKDWAGRIAIHHGSLDSSVRNWVESGMRAGTLRAVVCTSSLDLGVDFAAVDLVIQIGSPKGAARLLQRAGRSGHQPDAVSHLAFVPTNAIELVELAAAQDSIRAGKLEARKPLSKPLDVLVQHVVTVAIGGGFKSQELLEEVRGTRTYDTLTDAEWRWVLQFVTQGGASLSAYPDFHRVEQIDEWYVVTQRRVISQHRMNIGTIASDAAMHVKYLKGTTLGTIEETFIAKLNVGDTFLFSGRTLQLVRIHDNTAYVRRSSGKPDSIARWAGGRMPLSSELSEALRQKIEQAAEGKLVGREMRALRDLFEIQKCWSRIPKAHQLLIERIKTRGRYQVFLFPFEGRLVHEGLGALFALRLSQLDKTTLTMACNDHGLVLQSPKPIPVQEAIDHGLFSVVNLEADILLSLNATEMSKRQFRQIARIAGLIPGGYPGQRKSASHVQASSNLFFDVFSQYDPSNLLLAQSRNEVLEFQLESKRMAAALERIERGEVIICDPPKVTPLSFPLLVDKLRERVSSETLSERVMRMQRELEHAADR